MNINCKYMPTMQNTDYNMDLLFGPLFQLSHNVLLKVDIFYEV